MESATLSPPPAGSAPPGRAGAGGSSTWARPTWSKVAFALLCVAALAGYFAFPTYPTYDSFYALLWGRDLLHLQLPDFSVYRGPTEHPLAIAFGMLCSLFGQGGARLMVLGSIGSFVAMTAGIYRLTRLCFGTLVAVLAAALLLSRLFDANLAAQGYLDLTYVALIVWATALEVRAPAARDARVRAARGRRAAAPGRVGAERRVLAVVRVAGARAGWVDPRPRHAGARGRARAVASGPAPPAALAGAERGGAERGGAERGEARRSGPRLASAWAGSSATRRWRRSGRRCGSRSTRS